MKKLMKKKISFFGKEFSVFALVLVGMMAFSSAALVGYLSNEVSGTTSVASPFEAYIAGGLIVPTGDISGKDITLDSIYGGDTVEATVKFNYLGEIDEEFKVIEMFMINSTGITCGDFESIEFDTCTLNCTVMEDNFKEIPLNNSVTCMQNGADSIILTDGQGYNEYITGETNVDQFKIKFRLNALGDYTLSAQILPYTED